jgi:hypothetical protein
VVELELLERRHGLRHGLGLTPVELERGQEAGQAGEGVVQLLAEGLGLGEHVGEGGVGWDVARGHGRGHGVSTF